MNTQQETFPTFADPVPASGYRWWYVDASSDDGREHLVVIAFIGSVFSPFYKRAVNRGATDPLDYCAINVALYRQNNARWVMTESRRKDVDCQTHRFAVSGSTLCFDGSSLVIDIDERAAPLPRRVRGRLRIHPVAVTSHEFELDSRGRHLWWPFSPCARVEVAFEQPAVRWSGRGYFDTNRGVEPLHHGFDSWHWSRTHRAQHTDLTYNAIERSGAASALALRVDDHGGVATLPIQPKVELPPTRVWRAPRAVHMPGTPVVLQTLEDTPFYARSILAAEDAPNSITMHESLSLTRLRANWVTRLIPFRMRFPVRR